MSQSQIAKYFIPCLLAVLVRSYVLSAPQTQPPDSASTQPQARILTDTWPIRKVVASPSGDLVFAGGDPQGGPALVLVTPDRVVKIAAIGDAAPGRPGLFFQFFGLFLYSYSGDFSINDRDEVAFLASLTNCGPPVETCGVSSVRPGYGLFLFSESSKQTIAIVGDPAPGTAGGVFNELLRTVINRNGTVLFAATVRMPDGTITAGLFMFSANRIDKVYVNGDPTPVGPARVFVPGDILQELNFPMFLSDEGTALFSGYSGQDLDQPVLFRYQNGTISKVIAAGDSAPGGAVVGNLFDVSANSRGDIVFRANGGRPGVSENLYYMGKDGNSFRIVGDQETTSSGYTLQFWAAAAGNSISGFNPVSLSVRPKVNDSGEVLFTSVFQQGNTRGQGLFLFSSREIRKIFANGDLVPGTSDSQISLTFDGGVDFYLNNLGMAIFAGIVHIGGRYSSAGVFSYAAGSLSKVLLQYDVAPGTDGESVVWLPDWYALGNSGRIALHATVCCGKFKEGIFVGQIAPPSPVDANPLAHHFVIPLYVNVLGKQPDSPGLYTWESLLRENCNADGFNQVAIGFFDSLDFRLGRPQSVTGLITLLYQTFLGRNPDPDGLAAWIAVFRQAHLSIALQRLIPSQEFQSLLPDRTDRGRVTTLVTRLYEYALGRNPNPTELAAWVDFIVATQDVETAATAFFTSPEFESRALTFRDYVTILYRAFLGRDPEAAALVGWEQFLRDNLLQVIKTGFISSAEFQRQLPELCTPPSITVSVSPTQVTVSPGATQQFTATISGTSNTAVVWTVDWTPGGNARVGTISANGLYTAPATPPSPSGTASVIALSAADSTILSIASLKIPGVIPGPFPP